MEGRVYEKQIKESYHCNFICLYDCKCGTDTGNVAKAAVTQEMIDFTDENSQGGWVKDGANGTITFQNGEGDDGFMVLESAGESFFKYGNSKTRQDGILEMDLTLTKGPNGARMLILFRYNSSSDWEGIGVDGTHWFWQKGSSNWGDLNSTKTTFDASDINQKHHIKLEYRGKQIKVYQDGEVIIDQTVDAFSDTMSGQIGMRVWGEPTETHGCALKFDNIKTSDIFSAVSIDPKSVKLEQDTAAAQDIEVAITGENTLSAIKNGSEVLERGTDYTVNGQNVTIKTTYLEKRSKVNPVQSWFLNSKMGRHRHSRLILTFRNRRYPIQEILRQTEQTALRKRVEAVL